MIMLAGCIDIQPFTPELSVTSDASSAAVDARVYRASFEGNFPLLHTLRLASDDDLLGHFDYPMPTADESSSGLSLMSIGSSSFAIVVYPRGPLSHQEVRMAPLFSAGAPFRRHREPAGEAS